MLKMYLKNGGNNEAFQKSPLETLAEGLLAIEEPE